MINERMHELGSRRSTIRELFEYGKELALKNGADSVFDFSLGNPSTPPPKEFTEKLIGLLNTQSEQKLHGYTSAEGDLAVRERIAEHIRASYGAPAFAENVCMTVGAAAALSGTLGAIATEGEQIILLAPYFPEYKVFAEHASLNVVEVATTEGDFRPDLAAIEGAITEKTAAIIVNSPNNPSGAVYTESEIRAIARILREKSAEYGKAIYLISDEPYRELVFEGSAPFIPCYYENTVVCYSFSKSLSIPGDRIGYVFVSPEAADSHALMRAIAGTLRALGYVCAPALLQHLIAECLGMTADVSAYEGCRDILANELSALGFSFNRPDGAFYMLLRSPSGDGRELSDTAKAHGVLIVPSEDFGCPGYARIAFCQSEKMIRDSIPAFKKIADEYRNRGLL